MQPAALASTPLASPALDSADPAASLAAMHRLLAAHRPWAVLTGAGLSTGSGIPDYRDAQGAWKRPPPVTLQDFMGSAATRQRYWARSLIGWPVFSQAQPNAAHRALAELEARGLVRLVITQNVDGLHQRASSHNVVDLHGRLDTVVCMQCGQRSARADFQQRLLATNADWQHREASMAPDGDADLSGVDFSRFAVPACAHCGGVLKPDVVFYGENVPRERVQHALGQLAQCGALLVVGSSLMVYSGLRFVHAALAQTPPLPVAAINLGQTRADAQLSLKWAAPCDEALQALLAQPWD